VTPAGLVMRAAQKNLFLATSCAMIRDLGAAGESLDGGEFASSAALIRLWFGAVGALRR